MVRTVRTSLQAICSACRNCVRQVRTHTFARDIDSDRVESCHRVMGWKLHYFALEYQGGTLVCRHTFTCACDAEEGARLSAKLSSGGVAIQVWGNLDDDLWDEAEILSREGETPWIDLDWAVSQVA